MIHLLDDMVCVDLIPCQFGTENSCVKCGEIFYCTFFRVWSSGLILDCGLVV